MKLLAPKSILLLSVAALLAGSSAQAATIANYTFDSGTTGWGVYNNLAGAAITNPSDTILTPAGGTAANALAYTYTKASGFSGVTSNFSGTGISLNDGEKLSLSMDFRFTSAPFSANAALFLFLGNQATPGTLAASDKAYGFLGSTSGLPGAAFRFDAGTATSMIGGADRTSFGTPSALAQNIADTAKHTLNFSIERSGADYILSGGVDTNSVTFTQVGATQFAFNTMGLAIVADTSAAANNPAIAIDNVSVTAVPEPTTVGLMGVGALAAGLVRRRKQSV